MNCFVKRILTALLICSFCLVSFVSCSGGIDKDEAKAFISDFFAAIVAEDYEKKRGNVSWVKNYNRFKESVSPREMNRICYNFKRELMFT